MSLAEGVFGRLFGQRIRQDEERPLLDEAERPELEASDGTGIWEAEAAELTPEALYSVREGMLTRRPTDAKLISLPDNTSGRFLVSENDNNQAAVWLPPKWQNTLDKFLEFAEKAGATSETKFWIQAHYDDSTLGLPQSIVLNAVCENGTRFEQSGMSFVLSENTGLTVGNERAYFDLGFLDIEAAREVEVQKLRDELSAFAVNSFR